MIEIQKNNKYHFSLYKHKYIMQSHSWEVPTGLYISQSTAAVLYLQWELEEMLLETLSLRPFENMARPLIKDIEPIIRDPREAK